MKKIFGIALALMLAGCSESAPEAPAKSEPAPAPQASAQQAAPAAHAAQFKEGVHYQVVNPAGKVDKPTVTEFFSFYCGGCYNMESRFLPTIVPALESKGLAFEQKHVNFARNDADYQTYQAVIRAFATVQEMGEAKLIKDPMFALMGGKDHNHTAGDKHGEGINSLADVRAIFVENGVNAEKFDAIAETPAISEQVELWAKEQRLYQVGSIPAFVVNNKYLINLNNIESVGQLVDLMAYLAAK
ncbi:thiol:disulfide interchange protein DsbA/DsbL [Marinobacter hydrocarbonoclasticus]|nr:thiol:disulfide interchange protein DsbA/DsbL [Marinobacter nauticus]